MALHSSSDGEGLVMVGGQGTARAEGGYRVQQQQCRVARAQVQGWRVIRVQEQCCGKARLFSGGGGWVCWVLTCMYNFPSA